jgi:hypothetical protein
MDLGLSFRFTYALLTAFDLDYLSDKSIGMLGVRKLQTFMRRRRILRRQCITMTRLLSSILVRVLIALPTNAR